ncbi:MAG: DUF2155 domain-containing protein [Pseudomonadota bacterium]
MRWCGIGLLGLCLSVCAPAWPQEQVEPGTGVVLRWLDKINGTTQDIEMANATSHQQSSLRIELGECRHPVGNPAGDAYAFLTIHAENDTKPVFSGWMIASSPALNPMEHPRYDVWVLRCLTQ